MSEKVRLDKKAKREIRREVQKRRADVMNAIAREILLTPLKKMAIKAHTDLMEKGQALIDDPNFDIRLKVLVSEEMENSRKCMEVFVRTPENN